MSKTIKDLTKEEVEAEVLRLGRENPDYVYQTDGRSNCFYHKSNVDEECNGCIFGQAFQNLGVSREWLAENTLLGGNSISIEDLWEEYHDEESPDSWGIIQNEQDLEKRWGECVGFLMGND